MILAKEFVRSDLAREMGLFCNPFAPLLFREVNLCLFTSPPPDFSTSCTDRPLIVQFGASNPLDFARAAEMVKPYCDGVDLNCGCPQTWAISAGIGCKLMSSPELVRDMVRAAKERCGEEFSISVKIRIHHDIQ